MRIDAAFPGQRGFTLLEVLIALAIFAAAAALYLPGIGQSLGFQARTEERTIILAEARSALASVGQDIPLTDGTVEREPRTGVVLRIDISPTDDQDGHGQIAHRVVIRAGRRGGRTISLETIKLGPAP